MKTKQNNKNTKIDANTKNGPALVGTQKDT